MTTTALYSSRRYARYPARNSGRSLRWLAACFVCLAESTVGLQSAAAQAADPEKTKPPGLDFIDTGFENASPLWYEQVDDGSYHIHLVYDHERTSPNRAAGHIHFRLHAAPGTSLTLEIRNLDNVWNGRHGSVARELKSLVTSEDGRVWKSMATEVIENARVRLQIEMPGPELYVARVDPYRVSDLERLLETIRSHPQVNIEVIGQTAGGRDLEIVRIGRPEASYRVFLRARAHPWEAGGNWVVQGLIRRLLQDDEGARTFRERYCVYILPMANKDGVAMGRTRFNLRGKDLNRDWNSPADPQLSPENHALEQWLVRQTRVGLKPHLAIEVHNDGNGKLHISRPSVVGLDRYLQRMEILEQLLRKHTWFTEGSTKPSFTNSGTLGEGWLLRFGVDAVVHEFNCHWIAGLEERPLGRHWEEYGANLATVFAEYFETVQP